MLYNNAMENFEQIKKAIEVEVNHRYININGKRQTFATFICSVIKQEIKKNSKKQGL